jgi:Na+/H+ antiporter NhaC
MESVHWQFARDFMLIVVASVAITWMAFGSPFQAHAQKAERGTQQWQININGWNTITVVDTSGVCLYYVTGGDGNRAIAAVPKTQLPQGTGCQ